MEFCRDRAASPKSASDSCSSLNQALVPPGVLCLVYGSCCYLTLPISAQSPLGNYMDSC